MDHKKKSIKAIRHKNKVGYLIFLEFKKKNSSLKITLLHHAASFSLSVEGGRMVKEWDFEAGIFFLNKKKYQTLFLMAIIGLFQCNPWWLPIQKWLKKPTNDTSFHELPICQKKSFGLHDWKITDKVSLLDNSNITIGF